MKWFWAQVYKWLPPLMVMVAIFILSSRQRIALSETYTINFLIFKSLHMIEYATLYLLLFRGFYLSQKMKTKNMSQMYIYALIIGVLYAMSDEIHQTFVPTREGTVRDVFIDTIGMTIMYTLIKRNLGLIKKYL